MLESNDDSLWAYLKTYDSTIQGDYQKDVPVWIFSLFV